MTKREVHTPAKFEVLADETCVKAAMATAEARPNGVMFTRPATYEWVNVTSREFIREVFDTAKGFVAAGVQPGDRVVLMASTRYEWTLLDFAIWAAGGIVVPIYPSSSLSQVRWIVEDSGAVFAITETREQSELFEHLLLDADGQPGLKDSTSQLARLLEINASAVDTLKFEGRGVDDADIDKRVADACAEDVASIVYTLSLIHI